MACSTFDSDQKNIDDEFEMEDREIQKSIERGPNPPIPSQIAIDPSDPSPIPPIPIKNEKGL